MFMTKIGHENLTQFANPCNILCKTKKIEIVFKILSGDIKHVVLVIETFNDFITLNLL